MKTTLHGLLLTLAIALASLGGCTQDTTTSPPSDSAAQDDLTVTHKWCDPTVETCVLPGVAQDGTQRPLLYLWRDSRVNNNGCMGECDPCAGRSGDFTLCDFVRDDEVLALVKTVKAPESRSPYCGEVNEYPSNVRLAFVEVLMVFGREALPARMTLIMGSATLGNGLSHDDLGTTALVSLRKLDEGWVVANQIEAAFDAPAFWDQVRTDDTCQRWAVPSDLGVLQQDYVALQGSEPPPCGGRNESIPSFEQKMWGPTLEGYGCTPRPGTKPAESGPPAAEPGGLEVDGE